MEPDVKTAVQDSADSSKAVYCSGLGKACSVTLKTVNPWDPGVNGFKIDTVSSVKSDRLEKKRDTEDGSQRSAKVSVPAPSVC